MNTSKHPWTVRRALLALAAAFLAATPMLACGGDSDTDAAPVVSTAADPLGELIASELAFSESAGSGVADAFRTYLVESAIVFRPGPTEAGPWLATADPGLPPNLSWFPTQAALAVSGEMGYTTGPYVASADGSPSSHGHYLSVWERGRNDAFRVILDVGTPGPAPDRAATPLSPDNGASEALNEVRELAVGSSAADSPPAGAEESLLVADRAFGEDQEAEGTLAALGRHATAGVRVHRSGRAPFVGPWPGAEGGADVQALVGERFATAALGSRVSRSGTFGFVYGDRLGSGGATGHFVRLWRRDPGEAWRLIVEVVTSNGP